jgi:hypothetical protein
MIFPPFGGPAAETHAASMLEATAYSDDDGACKQQPPHASRAPIA